MVKKQSMFPIARSQTNKDILIANAQCTGHEHANKSPARKYRALEVGDDFSFALENVYSRAMKSKIAGDRIDPNQQLSSSRSALRAKSFLMIDLSLLIGGISLSLICAAGQPAHAQVPEGTPLDTIRSAAERGDPQSQYELGRAYEDGIGVQADVKEAIKWYGMAAEQHFSMAQYLLGNILLYGEGGVAPDYALARKWLAEAARVGIPAAQRDLGKMYQRGLGGEPDPIWAWVWYDLAATGGDGKASELRDELSMRLESSQLAEARRLSADIAPGVAPPPKQNQPQ